MEYSVDYTRVAGEVARFSELTLEGWRVCLGEIASDPHPRLGYYVDRAIPIPGVTMRTWLYEITQETSISGDLIIIFTAEFFPEYEPVYMINEEARAVAILFLRENRRA